MSGTVGQQRAIFFDMDGTLTPCNTGSVYAQSLWRAGKISTFQLLGILVILVRYKLGLVQLEKVMADWIRRSAGESEQEVIERCSRLAKRHVVPTIFEEARSSIEQHRLDGDFVVILSASSSYIIQPVADALQIEHVLATPLHVDNGRFTGGFDEPVCYGTGKVVWAKRFCEERGLSLEESYFYTDSFTDVPLLELVEYPIVVNPDIRLERRARRKGWDLRTWKNESKN